jgi:hypothetical protein
MITSRLPVSIIVGWTFETATYHPECLPPAWRGSTGSEEQIKQAVWRYGADELKLEGDDPRWWDSAVLPQPVFATDEIDDMVCDDCREALA